jgi:hypothetical protein
MRRRGRERTGAGTGTGTATGTGTGTAGGDVPAGNFAPSDRSSLAQWATYQ